MQRWSAGGGWCICTVGVQGRGNDNVCETGTDEVRDGIVTGGYVLGKGSVDGTGHCGDEESREEEVVKAKERKSRQK